ncbi:transferrin-binding protein-like solute binding protein [Sphingomonas sp. JC676]|uniref:transferrin-binding protein-like solute binding protein n=1 Tax=Sphingomonas sp. JC676 TaxID=2768065 RepID=UPI003977AFF6
MGYKSDPRTYDVGGNIVYGPGERVAAESDARFTTFRVELPYPYPGNGVFTRTFTVYNSGPGNPELVLNYLSFAEEAYVIPDGRRIDTWRVFGIETLPLNVPRTGTGAYRGVVYGSAIGAGGTADRYTLNGTVGIDADFAAQSFTGSMALGVINSRTSAPSDLGTYSFNQLSFPGKDGYGNVLTADITGTAGTTGRLYAHFFGPAAEEVGGHFSLITPGAGTVLTATGTLVAKRP